MLKVPAVLGRGSRTFPSAAMASDVRDVAIAVGSPSRGKGFGAGGALVMPKCQPTLNDCFEFALSLIDELSTSASAVAEVPDYLEKVFEEVSAALARGRCVDEDSPGILGAELVAVAQPRASSGGLFVEDRGPDAHGEDSHGILPGFWLRRDAQGKA